MAPLMLFLTSSLNTEMVYTILHGICKFTLLNFMRNEFSKEQMKQFRQMEYRVDRQGDTTITLREIKINNIDQWDQLSVNDLLGYTADSAATVDNGSKLSTPVDRRTKSHIISLEGVDIERAASQLSQADSSHERPRPTETVINAKTEITYHQLYEFGKLFDANMLSLQMLEKSFSPDLNREQVFKTSEGSGKSGSFFFLTHDKRFMIKTIGVSERDIMLNILPSFT